ncbi:MAG: hypothetical protein DPW09_01485 [Anaerolineae bacterium]|nr:hypothetical protein [Anaerolineae bacterium]
MKQILTVASTIVVVVLILAAQSFAAGGTQPQSAQLNFNSALELTATPQIWSTPVNYAPTGRGMGMRGGMMGGSGMMQGYGMTEDMAGGVPVNSGPGMMQGFMNMMANAVYNMTHGTMMTGETPMYNNATGLPGMSHEAMMAGANPTHAEAAMLLGMTTQDLHNQMALGKSLVQIAAEKGATEQQLVDTMMAGRRAAFYQAVQEGRMNQGYADTMLQTMESNFRIMANASGAMGWNMMWDPQSTESAPFSMHH